MVSSKESMAIWVFVLRGNMSLFPLPAFKTVLCLVFSTFFFGIILGAVYSAFWICRFMCLGKFNKPSTTSLLYFVSAVHHCSLFWTSWHKWIVPWTPGALLFCFRSFFFLFVVHIGQFLWLCLQVCGFFSPCCIEPIQEDFTSVI